MRFSEILDLTSYVVMFNILAFTCLQARTKIRVVCSRPYHAMFMHNMLIRPTQQELENFGEPDFVVSTCFKPPV